MKMTQKVDGRKLLGKIKQRFTESLELTNDSS